MLKIIYLGFSALLLSSCAKVECHSTEVTNIVKKIADDNELFEEDLLEKHHMNSEIYKNAVENRKNCFELINRAEGYNLKGELECIDSFNQAEDEMVKSFINDFKNVVYEITDIVTLNKDAETSRLTCEGNVSADLTGWGKTSSRLEYIVDVTSDDKLLVHLSNPESDK